jgi:hypothetical protein
MANDTPLIDEQASYSVPDLCKRWKAGAWKIHSFLRRGELVGFNIATNLSARPQWRFTRESVEAFERRRSSAPPPKPSREDIRNRVIELTDPKKYAEKLQKAAEKAAQKDADKDADKAANDDAEPEAPENLIPTEVNSRPAPNWKDVPDGMAALFQEGCKQQPGHSSDMMRDFAKQFVWTAAMVMGLVAGIADSKDGEAAEVAMQTLVDHIADEYSIFPAKEYFEEAA